LQIHDFSNWSDGIILNISSGKSSLSHQHVPGGLPKRLPQLLSVLQIGQFLIDSSITLSPTQYCWNRIFHRKIITIFLLLMPVVHLLRYEVLRPSKDEKSGFNHFADAVSMSCCMVSMVWGSQIDVGLARLVYVLLDYKLIKGVTS
jgi:hypothetical protein